MHVPSLVGEGAGANESALAETADGKAAPASNMTIIATKALWIISIFSLEFIFLWSAEKEREEDDRRNEEFSFSLCGGRWKLAAEREW